MLGGTFNRHPKLQPFTVQVRQPNHPATKKLPGAFEWADECYYFHHLNPDISVLLLHRSGENRGPEEGS